MRIHGAILSALALAGCPSLDGFVGPEKDATLPVDSGDSGVVDSGDSGGDSGPAAKGFLSVSDAAKLCSRLQTCPNLAYSIAFSLLIPVDGKTYSNCIDILAGPLPPNRFGAMQQIETLTCASRAANCEAAGQCLPYETISPGDSRCTPDGGAADAGATDSCSGDGKDALQCTGNLIVHCGHAHFGQSTCMLDTNNVPRCAAAPTCSLATGTCTGSVVSYCGIDSDFTVKIDCSYWGASCGLDQASGLQDCTLNGIYPVCAPPDAVTCISDRVRACYGSVYGEIDCVAIGAKCDPYPTPHCARATDACKQTDTALNVCSGDNIELCVAGSRQTLNCTSLGMKCLPGANGSYCG